MPMRIFQVPNLSANRNEVLTRGTGPTRVSIASITHGPKGGFKLLVEDGEHLQPQLLSDIVVLGEQHDFVGFTSSTDKVPVGFIALPYFKNVS
jgi:hypothetical protein